MCPQHHTLWSGLERSYLSHSKHTVPQTKAIQAIDSIFSFGSPKENVCFLTRSGTVEVFCLYHWGNVGIFLQANNRSSSFLLEEVSWKNMWNSYRNKLRIPKNVSVAETLKLSSLVRIFLVWIVCDGALYHVVLFSCNVWVHVLWS